MSEVRLNVQLNLFESTEALGLAAGKAGAAVIRDAIAARGRATIIVATGVSQYAVLDSLLQEDLPWDKVTAFHLDEYVGLPETHAASFRKYLKERFVSKVYLAEMHFIDGDSGDPDEVCRVLGARISQETVDVAFVGMGENAHLAFNDPPADFDTETPYIVVTLDEACRMQQVGEGWFPGLKDVPEQAISMSIREILRARVIINSCPEDRKAAAVRAVLEGPISPGCPASILRAHRDCRFYLDGASAAQLSYVGKM